MMFFVLCGTEEISNCGFIMPHSRYIIHFYHTHPKTSSDTTDSSLPTPLIGHPQSRQLGTPYHQFCHIVVPKMLGITFGRLPANLPFSYRTSHPNPSCTISTTSSLAFPSCFIASTLYPLITIAHSVNSFQCMVSYTIC